MIPRLYSESETNFNSNGICALSESVSAIVTEEANSIFTLELEYPIHGMWFSEIKRLRLIKALPNVGDEEHIFRIKEIVKSTNPKMVRIYASTKSEDLNGHIIKEFERKETAADVILSSLPSAIYPSTNYLFHTDITTKVSPYWFMRNVTNSILGSEGSLVDLLGGGELKRNNDSLYLYRRRGRENVTRVTPRKNLRGLEITESTKGLITRIQPYMILQDQETYEDIIVIGDVVSSQFANNYPNQSVVPMDFSGQELENKTQLDQRAASYFTSMNPGCDTPNVTLKVDLINIRDSSEYSKFKDFETVKLFDTVTVYVPRYDVDVLVKIVSVTFDVLREKVIKITAGQPSSTFMQDLTKTYNDKLTNVFENLKNDINMVMLSADGKNKVFTGPDEPDISVSSEGDTWFKVLDNGEMEMYIFDGTYWQVVINANTSKDILDKIDQAEKDIAQNVVDIDAALAKATQAELDAGFSKDLAEEVRLLAEGNATDVDTLTGKVTRLTTNTDGNTTQIGLLQTSYDGLSSIIMELETNKVGNEAFSALEQNLSGFKTTVQNTYADKTTVTTLANQWTQTTELVNGHTSTINSLGDQINLRVTTDEFKKSLGLTNLIVNGGNIQSTAGWYGPVGLSKHVFYKGNTANLLYLNTAGTTEITASSEYFNIEPNTKYTVKFTGFASYNVSSMDLWFLSRKKTSSISYDNNVLLTSAILSNSGLDTRTITFTTNATDDQAYIRFDNNGSTTMTNAGLYIVDIILVKGEVAPDSWFESPSDTIMSQINISPESILIASKKIQIKGDTYIDNGVIKTAHIADLAVSGAKIANASIGNAKIINLDASKITTGILNAGLVAVGANYGNKRIMIDGDGLTARDDMGRLRLSIGIRDLAGVGQSDPSNVVFYSGNGKNSMYIGTNVNDTFVIAPAGGSMQSLFNMPEGLIISSKQLRLTDPRGTSDYLEIRRTVDGTNEMIVFPSRPFSGQLGSAAENRWFRVLRSSQIIGHTLNLGYGEGAPHLGDLSVGADSGTPAAGSTNAFVRSRAIYNRIYGSIPSVGVTKYGTLGRIVSARKYKEQITHCASAINNARKVLEISPSEWYIKGRLDKREYGFIADDFHEVGLHEVVQYGLDGQVEGLAYDRVSMYLVEVLKDHDTKINRLEKRDYEVTKLIANASGYGQQLYILESEVFSLKKRIEELEKIA